MPFSLKKILFSRTGTALLALAFGIGGALAARKHASFPYVWFFGILAVMCMVLACCARRNFVRYTLISLCSLLLACSALEIFLRPVPKPSAFTTITENGEPSRLAEGDAVLGYRPRAGVELHAVRKFGDTLIYDARYTLDEHARRVAVQNPEAHKAVLFFGCSFTFGDGLNDKETFPFRVSERLGFGYQVFNLGFSGYGGHQFLAMLQSSLLDDIFARYDDIQAFYLTFASQEYRPLGLSGSDRYGPRFVVQDGRAVRDGTFSQTTEGGGRLDWFFRRSFLYRGLFPPPAADPTDARTLPKAINLTATDALRRKNAKARFTVLVWPDDEGVEAGLRASGIDTLLLGRFLPDYARHTETYTIKGDHHPNAHAAALVGEGLAAYILEREKNSAP